MPRWAAAIRKLPGPAFHRLDFSLFKAFPITERKRFEFRIEAFNLTNTPNFALPGSLNFLDTVNFAQDHVDGGQSKRPARTATCVEVLLLGS